MFIVLTKGEWSASQHAGLCDKAVRVAKVLLKLHILIYRSRSGREMGGGGGRREEIQN